MSKGRNTIKNGCLRPDVFDLGCPWKNTLILCRLEFVLDGVNLLVFFLIVPYSHLRLLNQLYHLLQLVVDLDSTSLNSISVITIQSLLTPFSRIYSSINKPIRCVCTKDVNNKLADTGLVDNNIE
jgi:hypothetical protein